MTWQEEIQTILETGCTDSDIEDFIDAHPDVKPKDIWNYVAELHAPSQCKGCKFIQLIGMGRCLSCKRQPGLKDYYEKNGEIGYGIS